MIAENIQTLLNLIKTVPALAASVGLTVGGQETDPQNIQLDLPAAWVLHAADRPDAADGNIVMATQLSDVTYLVLVFLPFISQSDLLSVQFPLLESVINAVHGQDAPSGHRFAYHGQRITVLNPGRITYEQVYVLRAVL